MDELKTNIKAYLELNIQIDNIKQQNKLLKKEKKVFEVEIIKFMKNQNLSNINSNNNQIKFTSSERKENLNKKVIKNQLLKYIESDSRLNEEDLDNMMSFIYKYREKNVMVENLNVVIKKD